MHIDIEGNTRNWPTQYTLPVDIAGNTCNKPTHCLLISRVILAISLHIACSLTAYAKYLQLAYSGTGNLQVFIATYM